MDANKVLRRRTLLALRAGVAMCAVAASSSLAQTAEPNLGVTPTPANDATNATAATADSPGDDAIIVTARRREENLNTVPIAVTAFSAAQLQKRQIVQTGDLVKVTPGLNISSSGNFVPYITIRAQTRGLTGPGTPGVLTYFNEVPLPTTGSLISTFDMSNIQVLKGPQGTLFGRNATGGAVLTYSKVPVYKIEGYAQADYAEYNSLRLQGAVNLPIVADKLAIRVAGEYTRTDGFTDTTQYSAYTPGFAARPGVLVPTKRDYDEVTTKGIRGSILFEPTDGIRNVTVVDYIKYRGANNSILSYITPGGAILPDGTKAAPALFFLPTSTIIASLTPSFGAAGAAAYAANVDRLFRCTTSPSCNILQFAALAKERGPRHAFTDLVPDARNTLFGVSNTTTVDIADWLRFKNIFGYRSTKTFHNPDVDGTPMAISDVASRSNIGQYTDEAQFSGEGLEKKLKYVAGFFYYKTVPSDGYGFSSQNVNNFGGLSNSSTFSYLSERSTALYAQVDYSLSRLLEGLGVTAGYRYTWDKASGCAGGITYSPFGGEVAGELKNQITKQQCESKTIPTFPGAVRTTSGDFVKKSHKGTYTLGLNWQITPRTLLYGVTRRGYRAAGFNTPTYPAAFADVQTFEPETITDVEIGLKTDWKIAGIRGNFTGDIYRGKDKGYQVYQIFTGTALQTIASGALVNRANLTIQGVEAGLTVNLLDGLVLGGDFAYTDVNIGRQTLPASVAAAFTAAGRTPPSVVIAQQPDWQANARLDYTVPGTLAEGELTFSANYHYQTSYASNDYRIPGYDVVDARVTLANAFGRPVDISVFARNLFDNTYFSGPQSGTGGLGVFSYMVAPPRVVGGSVRVRFGG